MHIITARTSSLRKLEDHQTINRLVSFDKNQGQIHVEVISMTVHDMLMSRVA